MATKKWYAKNKEVKKKQSQNWRIKNRARMLSKLREYRTKNYSRLMLIAARYRAKKQGVLCTITVGDIIIPERCPILGIPLEPGNAKWAPGSPSLDRIIPAHGYVPGNARVISWRANNLKKDATADKLEHVAAYIRGEI